MNNEEIFNEANDIILDCFGGADGGVTFAMYNSAMKEMAKRADNGDKAASEICLVVERFSRLINILRKRK